MTLNQINALPFDYLEAAPSNWKNSNNLDPKIQYENQFGNEIVVDDLNEKIGGGLMNTINLLLLLASSKIF